MRAFGLLGSAVVLSCVHAMPHAHSLSPAEAAQMRPLLVHWFHRERRRMPWRGDTGPFPKAEPPRKRARDSERRISTYFANPSNGKSPDEANGPDAEEAPGPPTPVSPYGTWVSEVMLQQTRVETVVPYYLRWMDQFPTPAALAAASEEEVNAAWAGLGYYRRARMLHAGAKIVADADFPDTYAGLLSLPGVGAYTAAAIASVAFGLNVGVVDGNVLRVVARLRGVVASSKSKALADISREFMAELVGEHAMDGESVRRPGDLNQAIMEIGGTVCLPSGAPQCEACPLATHCVSRRVKLGELAWDATGCDICDVEALASLDQGRAMCDKLPLKEAKKRPRRQLLGVLVAHQEGRFLMRKRGEGLLAGQWEFPHVTLWDEGTCDAAGESAAQRGAKASVTDFAGTLDLAATKLVPLGEQAHIFSHRKHEMIVFGAEAEAQTKVTGDHAWMNAADMKKKGLTTGMKKVLKMWESGREKRSP